MTVGAMTGRPPVAGAERLAQPLAESGAGFFEGLLKQAIDTTNGAQSEARAAVDAFLRGENEEIHQVTLAVQKAELTFEMFMQTRNKLMQAYQEVMRTQL